jgi:ABC-2 type transport system ATP-binding protein
MVESVTSPAADLAVEVESLTMRYGDVLAVDGVSFVARFGEVTAVLGPNGAGKTSTIEACEGYRRPTGGRVAVVGYDPSREQRALSEHIGVMLQEGGVYPSVRVIDAVRHYAALAGTNVDPHELVERVGLTDRAGATWRRLSGGERQRLSLALALTARPEVAFLDEPTSGVDVNGRDTIRTIVGDLAAGGCAVVLATHELDEAERLADRAVIFDGGRLIADGTLAELRRGHDQIRFRSAAGLDTAALAATIGTAVRDVGDAEFVIDASPEPQLISRLAGWLAEQGLPLDDVRGGAERLEDVFRRLTAKDPDEEPSRRLRRR